jgi:hypothetical protein
MKKSLLLTLSGIGMASFLTTSCQESDAATNAPKPTPENGAQFKEGQGLSLTDEMKKAIGFKTAEVTEEEIPHSITVELTATGSHEARGPLPPLQGTSIKPGMEIILTSNGDTTETKGLVRQIEKIPFGTPGDLEAIISVTDSLTPGKSYQGTAHFAATGPVPAVPASALLTTAEGTFLYAVNGSAYVRTPVKIGAINGEHVEISDGLYSGDEIVTTPVMSLWMAELQVLRGGKACTCGH